MDENRIQLVVSKGPNPGQTYPLLTTAITIGRDPMADIVFNDPEVSRQHVRLLRTPDGYQITDLGSTNGTFINGEKLGSDPLALQDGDEIAFGSGVTVLYQALTPEPAEPEATVVDGPDLLGTAVDNPFDDWQAETPPPMPAPAPDDDFGEMLDVDDEPEPPKAAPPPPPLAEAPVADRQAPLVAPGDVDIKKRRRRRTMIVVVTILLLLCCCLAFAISGYFWWGDLLLEYLGFI